MAHASATPATDSSSTDGPALQRRRRWPWVVAGLAAVAVVAIVLGGLRSASFDAPRDVAMAYLEAIADGDVAAANALAADEADALPAEGSMDDAETITGLWVSESSRATTVITDDGDFAAEGFDVRYDLGGETFEESIWLVRTETSWLSANWHVRDSLVDIGALSAPTPLPVLVELQVAGESATFDSGTSEWSAPLYPGIYPIEAPGAELYAIDGAPLQIADGGASRIVQPGSPIDGGGGTAVRVLPSASAEDAVLAFATERLEACAATAIRDLRCEDAWVPLDSALDSQLEQGGEVVWSVVEQPVVEPDVSPWRWLASATVEATVTNANGTVSDRVDVEVALLVEGEAAGALAIRIVGQWAMA